MGGHVLLDTGQCCRILVDKRRQCANEGDPCYNVQTKAIHATIVPTVRRPPASWTSLPQDSPTAAATASPRARGPCCWQLVDKRSPWRCTVYEQLGEHRLAVTTIASGATTSNHDVSTNEKGYVRFASPTFTGRVLPNGREIPAEKPCRSVRRGSWRAPKQGLWS